MHKFNFDKWFRSIIAEDASVDPNTLTNMILGKDMKNMGYDWVEQVRNNKEPEDIYKMAPALAFSLDHFITEAKKDEKKEEKKDNKKSDKQEAPPEANQRDPNMISSDPNFNPCPAYLYGICRVDGRPCPFSILDYKECGKYFLASSSDPDLMEIPVGREQDPSYAMGRKA